MKKLILIGLMMLAGSALAEWVMVAETEEIQFFYDPDTIRKDGNMRRVWRLQNLKRINEIGVMSRRLRVEYDCKQERFQILDISEHSEPMASGKVLSAEIGSGRWTGAAPGTSSMSILEIVCAK